MGGGASDTVKGGGGRENMSSCECRARDGGKSILCKPAVPPSARWYSAQLFRGGWGGSETERGQQPRRDHTLSITCAHKPDLLSHICLSWPLSTPPTHRLQTTVLLPIDSLRSAAISPSGNGRPPSLDRLRNGPTSV